MWSSVRRSVLPALLLIGGLVSIIYGAIFHSSPVLVEQETKTTIDVPLEFPPPPGEASPNGGPAFPGGAPFGGPLQFIKKTVTRGDLVSVVESEAAMTREVTFGGVVRLDSGELKRTYSGKGPALCPS
jgi:hypothetical protein